VWYAESAAALNIVNRLAQLSQTHKATGHSVLAVVQKRLILENRSGILSQTHDQLDGRGTTDITSLANSVSKTTIAPL
jgi:hypothetical protein